MRAYERWRERKSHAHSSSPSSLAAPATWARYSQSGRGTQPTIVSAQGVPKDHAIPHKTLEFLPASELRAKSFVPSPQSARRQHSSSRPFGGLTRYLWRSLTAGKLAGRFRSLRSISVECPKRTGGPTLLNDSRPTIFNPKADDMVGKPEALFRDLTHVN